MHGTFGVMNVLDQTGHMEIKWDQNNDDEVETAETIFKEKIKLGYQAFKVKRMGGQGDRITTFDPAAEKIMLVPQLKGG